MTDAAALLFAPDGAWCWFQDPRALYINRQHERTYAGWMTRKGNLEVGAFDHRTRGVQRVTLKAYGTADDHNSPSLLVLADGRLMVFYARHNQPGLHCRTTTRPEDITEWDDEVAIANTQRATYCHPVYLRDEGRFYVFWRGAEWKPVFATSGDGKTWTPPRMLVQEKGREADHVRPYIKIVSDGKSAIHFAFTNGHPRDEPENSIHYCRYERGEFFRADGTRIGGIDQLPISFGNSDDNSEVVYNGKTTGIRAWIWDIALDVQGLPAVAYTRLPARTDHRYCCARWDGTAWVDREITSGGRWFPQTPIWSPEREPHYSGGMAFKHANPSVVYVSRPSGGAFEIEKWITADNGNSWAGSALTRESTGANVRPVVPRGYDGEGDHVLWMSGRYVHYTNHRTEIRLLANP